MPMAREFAKAWFSMFTDDDFVCQDYGDKWLYLVLVGQPALNYAGIQPMNMRRWQSAMRDGSGSRPTEREMESRLNRLESRRYVYTDPETGEVLVRTFMRSDQVARQPNVLKSALRACAHVESPKVASVLVRELEVLEIPEFKNAKMTEDVSALLAAARQHLEPLAEGLKEPFPEPFPEPLARPAETEPFPEPFPEGLRDGSVVVEVGVVSTDPATQVERFAGARDENPAAPPLATTPGSNLDSEPPSRCQQHMEIPEGEYVPPCGPCANFRKARERWASQSERRAAERRRAERDGQIAAERAEIAACLMCDDSGYRRDRAEVCTHDPEVAERAKRGVDQIRAALAKETA